MWRWCAFVHAVYAEYAVYGVYPVYAAYAVNAVYGACDPIRPRIVCVVCEGSGRNLELDIHSWVLIHWNCNTLDL